ncbi:hypothetical protein [Rhodopirellula sallentina]|uniref:hypothetical protein n=1 Tax=Rhodopirellula sallentina TaxID=1263869 RepID=UPI001F18642D|nr:hypothetical protein [Rhodopirellula sallentina]
MLLLALLVGTFAASVTQRATQERDNERHHQTIATLETAIDAVAGSVLADEPNVRLPVSSPATHNDEGQWVIVEPVTQSEEPLMYRATVFRDGRPGVSILRSANKK